MRDVRRVKTRRASERGGSARLSRAGKGARWTAECGLSPDDAAARLGCSVEMVAWRLNVSGARRLMKPAHSRAASPGSVVMRIG